MQSASFIDNEYLIQLPRDRRHLQFADCHGDLDLARAGHSTVEDGMAARQAGCLGYDLEPVGGLGIAAIKDKAMGTHQRGRAEIIVTGPEGRAGGGAGCAQDALGSVIEARTLFR